MHKILFSFMVCGFLMVACGQRVESTPSTRSTPPSPTDIPSSTPASMTLLAEKDLETQTGTAYSLDWSPYGEMLAVSCGVEIILLKNDLETVTTLKPASGALTATWSADQTQFATVVGLRNQTISIWDWDSSNAQLTLVHEIPAGFDQYGASWSPDGKLLASLANDRKSTIQIWDTYTWELLNTYELPYANPRRALNWSANSATLYDAGEMDGEVIIFALHVQDGAVDEIAKLPTEQVYAFGVSSDAEMFAVADEDGKVQLFDIASNNLLFEFQSVSEPVALVWNPVQKTLAILGYKTGLQLWDVSK